MENIEELCARLAMEKNNLNQHSSRIARMEAEINEAIQRTQAFFSDQPAGQSIIRLLSLALNELAMADSAFYTLGGEILSYVAELQK